MSANAVELKLVMSQSANSKAVQCGRNIVEGLGLNPKKEQKRLI